MIAGSTSYDANATALQAIESYWAKTTIAESSRYNQLSGPGITVNGQTYKLTTSTVKHAAASDTLTLGSDFDWLFWRMVGTNNDTLTGTPAYSTII